MDDIASWRQCFLDLMAMSACSTITPFGAAARIMSHALGEILDFPSLDLADKHTVIFIIRPTRRAIRICRGRLAGDDRRAERNERARPDP